MREISKEEWETGAINAIVTTFKPTETVNIFSGLPEFRDLLGLEMIKLPTSEAKVFLDDEHFANFLGELFPTKFLKPSFYGSSGYNSHMFDFNRVATLIAVRTRRGCGNHILTGADPSTISVDPQRVSPENIVRVDWLPKTVALIYFGNAASDNGLFYFRDNGKYNVIVAPRAELYGCFVVWDNTPIFE